GPRARRAPDPRTRAENPRRSHTTAPVGSPRLAHRSVRSRPARSPPQSAGAVGAHAVSYRDLGVPDFVDVVDTEAECGRVLDVPRLTHEPVDVRIDFPLLSRAEGFGVALPDGDRAFLLALGVDDVDEQPIHGHRIGPEFDLLRV